jgi:hypothetical protein
MDEGVSSVLLFAILKSCSFICTRIYLFRFTFGLKYVELSEFQSEFYCAISQES